MSRSGLALAYGAALLLLLGALAVFDPQPSIDFHAYYYALRYHEQTGKLPYQTWDGNPVSAPGSALSRFIEDATGSEAAESLEFLYPPTALVVLYPLQFATDVEWAARIWRLCNVAALLLCLGFVLRLDAMKRGSSQGLVLIALLAAYGPIRESVWLGQITLPITALMLFAYCFGGSKHAIVAGAMLGIACVTKLYPLLWLPMILAFPGRAASFLSGFLLSLLLIVALSLGQFGIGAWRDYFGLVLGGLIATPPNEGISLHFLLPRVPGLMTLMAAVIVGGVLYFRPRPDAASNGSVRAFAGYSALLFILMPLVWPHYLSLLGVLLAVGVARWPDEDAGQEERRVWGLALFAYLLTGYYWPLAWINDSAPLAAIWAGLVLTALLPLVRIGETSRTD